MMASSTYDLARPSECSQKLPGPLGLGPHHDGDAMRLYLECSISWYLREVG